MTIPITNQTYVETILEAIELAREEAVDQEYGHGPLKLQTLHAVRERFIGELK